MTGPQQLQFCFDLEALADKAVASAAAAMEISFDEVQRGIALALFWSRAMAVQGEWIDLALRGDRIELRLEKAFERGFVAHVARVLGGGRKLRRVK